MKNLKGIFIAVFLVAFLVIVGAVSYQAMVVSPRAAEQQQVLKQYNFPGNTVSDTKPSVGFPAGSSPESDINGMLQTLEESSSDDSTSDINQLKTEAEGL